MSLINITCVTQRCFQQETAAQELVLSSILIHRKASLRERRNLRIHPVNTRKCKGAFSFFPKETRLEETEAGGRGVISGLHSFKKGHYVVFFSSRVERGGANVCILKCLWPPPKMNAPFYFAH